MNQPAVSVIIPVYNRPREVLRAIDSVLQQDFSGGFEIIVIDDGSDMPPVFPERMKRDKRIRFIRFDRNRGASAARNAGVSRARGDWLAFLDSDDLWFPGKLALQMQFMSEAGEAASSIVLATGFRYVNIAEDFRKQPEERSEDRMPVASDDVQMFFSGCWFCPGSTVLMSRTLFEKTGFYDESLPRLEDLDWFARMVLAGGRVEVIPRTLVAVRAGDKAPYEKMRRSGARLLAKYTSSLGYSFISGDTIILPTKTCASLQAYLHLEYAASALKQEKDIFRAVWHLLVSLYYRPRFHLHLYHFWEHPPQGNS